MKPMNNNLLKAAFVVAAISLAACSSEAPKPAAEAKTDSEAAKKPAGPPEPVLAKEAFYEMYTPAHAWAADLLPLSLKSGEVQGVKNKDGKAGLWTAVFASPSQRASREYIYAVADELPTITKGVKAEGTEPWSGPSAAVMTFQTSDFMIDSDAAYKTAAEKAAEWLKDAENATKPVTMQLGAASRFPSPVWYILFGTSKAGFAVTISAASGSVMTK
ncbi:MAG TPA: hypothetical protein VK789_14355 [Bryobacteraceae bacterium]|jgi:hypothetical protein|nr:hypothetical protein [Bryobacteraceae bacterium]